MKEQAQYKEVSEFMNIIGINYEMLISSACLVSDGEIKAAASEERFSREKHTRAFPLSAISFCLKDNQLKPKDIDHWVISWNPGAYFRKFNPIFSGKRRHLVEQLFSVPDHLMGLVGRPDVTEVSQSLYFDDSKMKVNFINHHQAHAANAFYNSEFENAAIMVADSQGEFVSTSFFRGDPSGIRELQSWDYPNSLGVLYATITDFLGFRPNSDEWKVMALGAYASKKDFGGSLSKISELASYHKGSGLELNLSFFSGFLNGQPRLFTEKLEQLLGKARMPNEELNEQHFAIAAAVQSFCEAITFKMLTDLYDDIKETKLCVSGGFFMNSLMNGKLVENTPFEEIYIGHCPDDSGNAIGAALFYAHDKLNIDRRPPPKHNYFGPSFNDDELLLALRASKSEYIDLGDNLLDVVASELEQGKVVGWFQGRMEFGQRALGNRSILGDPRDKNMKEKINSVIKFREGFRPFAPAVLKEYQNDYFEIGAGGDALYMEKIYKGLAKKREVIPAVFHADDTCRIQTVTRNNELFYGLIESFYQKTGVPVLLNTSFNLNNEPIACSPMDALKTFHSSGLDCLALGRFLIRKV